MKFELVFKNTRLWTNHKHTLLNRQVCNYSDTTFGSGEKKGILRYNTLSLSENIHLSRRSRDSGGRLFMTPATPARDKAKTPYAAAARVPANKSPCSSFHVHGVQLGAELIHGIKE